MKFFLKLIFGIVIGLVLLLVSAIYYINWRKSRKYTERIEAKVFYMQYACGGNDLNMKVETVNEKKYRFMIGKDVALITRHKKNDRLFEFLNKVTDNYNAGKEDYLRHFIITGYLHKYPHGFPFHCSDDTPWFTVEKIAYGNGKPVSF